MAKGQIIPQLKLVPKTKREFKYKANHMCEKILDKLNYHENYNTSEWLRAVRIELAELKSLLEQL